MKRFGLQLSLLSLVSIVAAGCGESTNGVGASVGSQAGSEAGYRWFDRVPGGSTMGEWMGRKAGEQIDKKAEAQPASGKVEATAPAN